MIRNANVRRQLLFLVTEDRQAAIRWRFSRLLVAPAAQKVHGPADAIARANSAMGGPEGHRRLDFDLTPPDCDRFGPFRPSAEPSYI
jgi:hypothetical protein